jgi:NAD(P)-dependent dehydrogenase (short-subunit alcohol dehydrogenase family)
VIHKVSIHLTLIIKAYGVSRFSAVVTVPHQIAARERRRCVRYWCGVRPIFTVQKALPLMGEGGSIILTGSSAGTTGAPAMSAYSASKAAVRNLARTWAEDLKGTGIRVNVLSPGATATELAKEALGEEGMKVFASMTPLQRMADPAEIGAVAAFLASQDSSFMTGSEVAVDGGLAQL